YKNIFIAYLDEKESFTEKDVKEFFINLIKDYDNKIKYLIVGKKQKRINVLLMLDKRPCFGKTKTFNLVIKKKKDPKANLTLEPINIEKTISPQSIYEDIIAQSEQVCEDGIPSFIQEISSKTRKEQNEEYIDYMNRLRPEFNEDKKMSVDEARKMTFDFLYRTKNYMAWERASTVMQGIKVNFVRPKRLFDVLDIKGLNTFNLDNPQVQFIINHIKTQIQRLRDGHRAISLIIEGITKIGKTELIWAICKELNIIFNYMKGRINFSRKRYDDEQAEIDIWDDFLANYLIEKKLLESIFGGQIGFTVETAKHEPDRDIFKKKLNIFICNPHNSFQKFFDKNPGYKSYLEDEKSENNAIFMKLDGKLLFKKS
ncbi:replication protein, partial [Candidatus Phytoplasma melaleucae]